MNLRRTSDLGYVSCMMHHTIKPAVRERRILSCRSGWTDGLLPSALRFKPGCDVIALAVPEEGPAADKGDAETE